MFNKMNEEYKKKLKREKKEEKKKQQRNLVLKVMELRASYMNSFMKKTEKGENYILKWKDIKIGENEGSRNPQITFDKIKTLMFIKDLHYMFLKKDTPLKSRTMYDDL